MISDRPAWEKASERLQTESKGKEPVAVQQSDDKDHYRTINIGVHADYQGQGIGGDTIYPYLCRQVVARHPESKTDDPDAVAKNLIIGTSVFDDNAEGRKFYESVGFKGRRRPDRPERLILTASAATLLSVSRTRELKERKRLQGEIGSAWARFIDSALSSKEKIEEMRKFLNADKASKVPYDVPDRLVALALDRVEDSRRRSMRRVGLAR